jgi:hypothetical protein
MPLQKPADFKDCCTDEAGCIVCNALNSRNLEIDDTHYHQELLCEVWFLKSAAAMMTVQ